MALYPTPHINATPADFAPTVLMPGDPLRAKFIAENFIENARLVNNVRGVQGYTGFYKGKRVSVMASGMGMPSIGIYSYELYNFYGVENIIRIGTAGMINPSLHVRDIVAAYRLILEHGDPGNVYNIGSNNRMTIGNLLERIATIVGIPSESETDPTLWRPTDASVPLDVSALTRLGWTAKIPFEQTLRDIVTTMKKGTSE